MTSGRRLGSVVASVTLAALLSPVAAPPAAATTVTATDEAGYRSALATLSGDGSGPHRIELGADVVVDDGTDPVYSGTRPLTVDGNGHTLDGAAADRLLVVDSPTDAAVRLVRIRVRNGAATGDGGAVLVGEGSDLTIVDAIFTGNRATGSGGAVEAAASATVLRSDFVDNVAQTGDGGALDGTAEPWFPVVRASNFVRNRAPLGDGGAIGPLASTGVGDYAVRTSTLAGNRARRGGALALTGGSFIDTSTVVANVASVRGGGLWFANGQLSGAGYLTVTGNSAPRGANVHLDTVNPVYLFFSVVAERTGGGANCAGTLGQLTEIRGWSDDRSCGRGMTVGDPRLGPLGDHGGRTRTRLPLVGSRLIDAIERSYGPGPVVAQPCAGFQGSSPTDQRGVRRPRNGDGEVRVHVYDQTYRIPDDCDIGAVEVRTFGVTPR